MAYAMAQLAAGILTALWLWLWGITSAILWSMWGVGALLSLLTFQGELDRYLCRRRFERRWYEGK
jgi:hypothetical protein